MSSSNPPSSTVYVRNLEERIKLPTLTSTLRELFSDYGEILDIVAKQNLKAKGQAFIVFSTPEAASAAIEEINDFELFGKPIACSFARTRSDATVRAEDGEEGFERFKRARIADKERRQAVEAQKNAGSGAATAGGVGGGAAGVKRGGVPELANRPAKTTKGAGLKATGTNAAAVIPDEYLPPNKILFLRDLPEDYAEEGLGRIFERFDGFKEVRMVPGRKGIAFVEYEAEAGAISAKEATAGMRLGDGEGKGIRVTYQRQ